MSNPDENGDRKPILPRPLPAARGSGTPQPRPPSNTHSLLPSRSASLSRGTTPKMVFRPVRPPRRSIQIKEDPDGPGASNSLLSSSPPSAGPSRFPVNRPKKPMQRPPVQMTASGPFALGSSVASARNAGKSRSVSVNQDPSALSSIPGIKSESSSRLDYREPDKADRREREEYSDPEEAGVEIIDMEDVGNLDILAPVSLPRMKEKDKKKKKSGGSDSVRVKREVSATREEGVDIEDGGIELEEAEKDETTKNADALDLSASEDEEVMDDLLDDFVGDDPENRLYLFQFPPLFPTFAPPTEASQPTISKRRSVVFAEDTVGGGGAAGSSPSAKDEKVKAENPSDAQGDKAIPPPPRHEGQIGRLDVFRDGRVNFRFNDIIMEVTGGSQSSFLQQVMILDAEEKKATTLGELHRKFVVAPEVESMLNDVDQSYEAFNLSGSGGE